MIATVERFVSRPGNFFSVTTTSSIPAEDLQQVHNPATYDRVGVTGSHSNGHTWLQEAAGQ